MQVSRWNLVFSRTQKNSQAIKDAIWFNQSLLRIKPATRGGDQTEQSKPPTKFSRIILDFQKNVMLIYVSRAEQITDYLYRKLRSLFLHGSV